MTALRRVAFEIPGQPQPKQRARTVPLVRNGVPVMKNGRVLTVSFTPKETEKAESLVRGIARMNRAAWKSEKPIRMVLRFYRENARRADLDNLTKLVQDALNGVAYVDDVQIVDEHLTKAIDRARPRTEVELEELSLDGDQLELEAKSA